MATEKRRENAQNDVSLVWLENTYFKKLNPLTYHST